MHTKTQEFFLPLNKMQIDWYFRSHFEFNRYLQQMKQYTAKKLRQLQECRTFRLYNKLYHEK